MSTDAHNWEVPVIFWTFKLELDGKALAISQLFIMLINTFM